MRIALGIEYNGTGFCGWQSQPSGCGVQDHVEAALNAFLAVPDEVLSVICAGRTDTGVHAALQVVHFDCSIERDEIAWVRGVNAHLPSSIRVLWAKKVDPAFHARFSAISRSYRYLLLNDAVDAAILRGQVGWFHVPLAIEPMRAAASALLGEHDFSAFRAAECQAKSPVKTMHEITIERSGQMLIMTFRANAFLHHMIRNIVGGLVYVGSGRHSVDAFRQIFEGLDRSKAAPTFSPDGLYLADIEYDASYALPSARSRLPF
ncbi:MAG: tRNA pseudouridine(38-40) synthase TruA [Betaproteobacteria bacterium]|nr:tRNA pseudouridine(38-40) synthase TruA [Betaproteobacteria bacterium]